MAICGGDLLAGDFALDCDNKPIAGLTERIALINFDDIDRATTTRNAANTIVTNLALDYGKVAYELQGVKRSNAALASLVKKDLDLDKWSHGINGIVFNVVAETIEQLNRLSTGGRVVAVVERKFKGADQEAAFFILGLDSGLELATVEYNSNENGGSIPITLTSVAEEEEPYFPATWLETDYATTLAAFDALF